MNKFTFFTFLLFLSNSFLSYSKPSYNNNLEFVQNAGQWESPVKYKADLHGGWLFLENNTLTYLFQESLHDKAHGEKQPKYLDVNNAKVTNPNYLESNEKIIKGHAYKVKWLNANTNPVIEQEKIQSYYNNYFIGSDVSKWKSNVPVCKVLKYNNVYDNIDFKIYSEDQNFKSDYIVHRNGKVTDIQFKYDGVDDIAVLSDGRLKITTSINTVYELKPYSYQIINNQEKEIACSYSLKNNVLTFNIPKYNKEYDLIIDPSLIFSTYSGSNADNWGSSSTNDAQGNMFLGGIALASGYPSTVGAFQTTFGGGSGSNLTDVVITKFNSTGSARIYSTYLGGSSNELLQSLYCTQQNELIILSTTSSTNFPTSASGYDKTHNGGASTSALLASISFPNGSDIAVTKLNAAGSALIGSTFFGGSGTDGLSLNTTLVNNYGDDSRGDIAVDNSGNIYIVSTTTSTNIPGTTGKAQPTNSGSSDGVIAQFNSNLSALNWSTYYGGSGADAAYSLSLDAANNIFVCGGTLSNNIPGRTAGLNTAFIGGSADGYVAKLNPTATTVSAATYLGTSSFDEAYIMDLDKNDNVYIFGQTLGAYPVTAGTYSNTGGKQFIHRLNNNLNATGYSTVFGTTNYQYVNISPTALLVDICSNVYAVGWGGGINFDDFPNGGNTNNMPTTADAYKSNTDGKDFYLINLGTNASSLKYATYFGEQGAGTEGDHVDGGTSRFDKNGVIYEAVCASCGGTDGFPTTAGAYSNTNNSSNCNMAGFKFKFDLPSLQITGLIGVPSLICAPQTLNFSYTTTTTPVTVKWYFGDGDSSTLNSPAHTYLSAGTYTITLKVFDPTNCNPVDSFKTTINVLPKKTTNLVRVICQGESVTVGTQTFSNTGNFVVVLQSSQGCDSTVNLNLTVNPKKTTTLNREICQGQSVTVGSQTFNTPGTFTVTLQTSNFCDSVVTLNLVVNPTKTNTVTRTICQGQSVTVGTQTFNTNGTFVVNLLTSKLCDSIVTLNLTVNPTKTTQITRSICQGQSVTVGTQTFNTNGTFVVNLQTSERCDSIVTLNLTVNPVKTTNLVRSICQGQTFTIGNQTFSSSGNYSVTLQSSQLCDSVVNLNLTVTARIINNISRSICEGQSFTVGTKNYTQTGNYSDTLRSGAGCDSVVNLNLTVNPIKTTNLFRTICQGESVTVGTQTFNTNGVFTIRLTTTQTCDSIVTLNLTVNPTKTTSLTRVVCQGESVTVGNQTFNASGSYTVILKTSKLCDSTVTLNLTVNPVKTTSITRNICQGQSVTVGNQVFSSSGNYTVVLKTSANCDSTVNLNLTVTSRIINNITRVICQGESVTVGNSTYNQTGNFTDTLRSLAGCDSVVNLQLTVNPKKQTTLNRTICQGESVTVGNQTFNTTGSFTIPLQTSQFCDSTVTLNLLVNPKKQTTVNRTICQGESVTVGNQTFNTAGSFTVTLQTSQFCDSVVTLNLIVNPIKTTNLTRAICEGESVTIGNQVFTATGNYSVVLKTSLFCDSTVNLNLTVNPKKATVITDTICQGDSIIVGTQVFSTTGTFVVNLLSSKNCDSTVTLNLFINPTKTINFPQVICLGDSVKIGNEVFKSGGNYSVVLQTSKGCDSIINLNLTVLDTTVNTFVTTICDGDSIKIGNEVFRFEGLYTVKLKSTFGCDSTIILDLRIKPTQIVNINQTICEGESYTVGNQSFSTPGLFSVVLQTSRGCDSIVNLDLKVNPSTRTNIFRIICQGESFTVGNEEFSESGNYAVTLQTQFGCDSVVNLDLQVNPIKLTELKESICRGQSISVGSQVFSESGQYTVNLQTSESCDSIVNLDLTVTEPVTNNISFKLCQGDAYSVGDSVYTKTGNYTNILEAASGCDSIVNLSLIVDENTATNLNKILCEGDSVTIGNQTFKISGIYQVVLENSNGCDSTVNLNLTVNSISTTSVTKNICSGENFIVGNETFTETGEYTIVLQNTTGCDSTVLLNLIVNNLPSIDATADQPVVNIGQQVQLGVLTSEALNYNWTPADIVSNPAIQNPTAVLSQSTWFYVTATNRQTSCSFTDSVFVELNEVTCSKENIFIPNAFTPNGDGINDLFIPRSSIILKSMKLIIIDRWGNQVFESTDITVGWDGNYKGQPATVDSYGYYFVGECSQGEKITIKGNVSLLR